MVMCGVEASICNFPRDSLLMVLGDTAGWGQWEGPPGAKGKADSRERWCSACCLDDGEAGRQEWRGACSPRPLHPTVPVTDEGGRV